MTIEIKNDAMLGRLDESTLHAELIKRDKEIKLLKAKLELYKGTLHNNHALIKKLNDIEKELEYMTTDVFFDKGYDIKEKYWYKLKKIINREA